MRRSTSRSLDTTADAARRAMAVGSLEFDRQRDISDWETIRRILTVYMPLMATVPVLGSLIYFWNS